MFLAGGWGLVHVVRRVWFRSRAGDSVQGRVVDFGSRGELDCGTRGRGVYGGSGGVGVSSRDCSGGGFVSGGGCRLLVHVRRRGGVSGMCYLNIRTEEVLCLWWEIFNFLFIYLIRYSLWFFLKSSDCLKYGNFIFCFWTKLAKSKLLLVRKNSPVGFQTHHFRFTKRLCWPFDYISQ